MTAYCMGTGTSDDKIVHSAAVRGSGRCACGAIQVTPEQRLPDRIAAELKLAADRPSA